MKEKQSAPAAEAESRDSPQLIDKSQLQYGAVYRWIIMASCIISLIAPVFILMFPRSNLLNPHLVFNAIFEGKNPVEVWEAAGVAFQDGEFWRLFFSNIFAPDGFAAFGMILGCSVAFWALMPAVWQFGKKKEYLYVCVSLVIMGLIAIAMSGIANISG
ncbi:MAG: hypothetical protein FWC65_01975 [Treponema sp.]|nr:hypothetical protein [Treponema sp.]